MKQSKYLGNILLSSFLLAFTLFTSVLAITPEAEEKLLKETCQELVCTCGCGNMILDTCTCGKAGEWKRFLRGQIREGKTKEQMLVIMAGKYGEQVLAAPPKEGINWVLWVVIPYLVPVLGAAVLGVFMLKWVKRKKDNSQTTQSTVQPGEQEKHSEYEDQIEKELKDFEK